MNLKCIHVVLQHGLYRSCRLLFIWLQHLFFSVFPLNQRRDDQHRLEVFNIVFRWKLLEIMVASPYDFVYYSTGFHNCGQLDDERWSLYCIDEQFVYLVFTAKPTKSLNVKEAPFMFVEQWRQAIQIGRMTLADFAQWGFNCQSPRGNLVVVPSAARSGSTAIVSVLQCDPSISVYGVNDVFTNLSLFESENILDRELRSNLLISCLKFFCRNQQEYETVVLKPRGMIMIYFPLISKMLPRVKMFYIFRRTTQNVLESVYKMRMETYGDIVSMKLAAFNEPLAIWIYGWFVSGCSSWKGFGRRCTRDYSIIMHVFNWVGFQRNVSNFHIDRVDYEDFLDNPLKSMIPIFQMCRIPENLWTQSVRDSIGRDSQAGTALSRPNMSNVVVDKNIFSIHQIEIEIRRMCQELGVDDWNQVERCKNQNSPIKLPQSQKWKINQENQTRM